MFFKPLSLENSSFYRSFFSVYCLEDYSFGRHGGTMVSTVTAQQEGSGCLRGFLLGVGFLSQPKAMSIRLGYVELATPYV